MKRECGGCTQCCKVMGIAELNKPPGKWCHHCKIGSGCAIQGTAGRPASCAAFDCLWLQGLGTDAMRPDKSKIVMTSTNDGESIVLRVDPSRPDAHRVREFEALIRSATAEGRKLFVVIGDKRSIISSNPSALKGQPK